jgi:hypothetical protein
VSGRSGFVQSINRSMREGFVIFFVSDCVLCNISVMSSRSIHTCSLHSAFNL